MAARSNAVRQAASAPKKQSRPARLGVVDRRNVLDRARRRQARVLISLSGVVLAGALTVAAAGHALLASSQYQADGLQGALSTAIATQQNLQAEKSLLDTPSRILGLAEHKYKMVTPSGVTYLQPVNPGETVEQAHTPASPRKSPEHHHAR
jgi:hypothetical protein